MLKEITANNYRLTTKLIELNEILCIGNMWSDSSENNIILYVLWDAHIIIQNCENYTKQVHTSHWKYRNKIFEPFHLYYIDQMYTFFFYISMCVRWSNKLFLADGSEKKSNDGNAIIAKKSKTFLTELLLNVENQHTFFTWIHLYNNKT